MATDTTTPMSVFQTLNAVNVNKFVEKKGDLTYLSWADAWGEVSKKYPNATYEIWKDANNLPYVYDEKTGYMVYTSVTIEGVTHAMWLPVMDGSNNAMKATPYTYKVIRYVNNVRKEQDKTVDAATMFDINKTLMRCLTKNLAMFGLGLYIYRSDDQPEGPEVALAPAPAAGEEAKVPPRALIELKTGSDNWKKASKFIKDNKQLGFDKIVAQLRRKYTITAEIAKEIEKLIQ